MKKSEVPVYFKELFDRYKYILLVCLVGLLLMVWPENSTEIVATAVPDEKETLEVRLRSLLEEMEGVGKARVLLTVETGEETAYAYDRTETQNQSETGGSHTRQAELVTVSQNGGQTPVQLRTTSPTYRGAVVVCQGGGSAAVRLAVTQVIQSLTGISADRIVISKMK